MISPDESYPGVMENRLFRYALFLSLLVHILLIVQFPRSQAVRKFKPLKNIEITYTQSLLKVHPVEKPVSEQPPRQEKLKGTARVLSSKMARPDSFLKDAAEIFRNISATQKQPVKIAPSSTKRRISLPPVKPGKITNPIYLNYYQMVRQKIKERAYANYATLDTGNVYLTFIIDARGALKQIKMIEEKTSAVQYLKDVSLKSIKEADPFPPFPADLKYPELSFNIVISFEEDQ